MDQSPADKRAPFPICDLLGMPLSHTDATGILDHMFTGLANGRGGWLVTANLDFLRRYVRDEGARALYAAADVLVADGMPLMWAARLQGHRLPERIAGSSLVWQIADRAAQEGRSVYLLGGESAANEKAVEVLRQRRPELVVAGNSSPMVTSPPTAAALSPIRLELTRTRPDIILVGMGSPKQEYLIRALRSDLPRSWMIGVGISFSFVAGTVRRAPRWVQQAGSEWVWRLAQEPRRLARRYLVEDLPFSFEMFARAFLKRMRTPNDRAAAGRGW